MSACPDIDELLAAKAPSEAAAHLEACAACGAVVALATFRVTGARASERPETCAAFEPALAALADGKLGAGDLAKLVDHLGRCASCNDLAARLTLFRGELDGVPEPEIEAKWSAPEIVEATGVREVTEVAARPATSGRTTGSRWRRAAPWAAAVACGFGLGSIGAALIFTRPPEAVASAPATSTTATSSAAPSRPGGALDVNAKIESLERRAREAEERAELAERSARAAQHRVELLEAEAAATAPSSASSPRTQVFEAPKGPPFADVSLYCAPSCEVTDNGKPFGTSPIHHASVAAGVHRFVLTNGDVTKTISVTLAAGDRISQRYDMTSYR